MSDWSLVDSEAVREAVSRLKRRAPLGATRLLPALDAAARSLTGKRPGCVLYIGDGMSSAELVEAGMDVARLNFSHGAHQEHAAVVADIRQLSKELGRPVAILQDLQGPKIRTGRHADGPVRLEAGQTFTITTDEVAGDAQRVSTTYESLPRDVGEGDDILLSDGLLRLVVRRVQGAEVECEMVNGGVLRERVGINLPGVELSVETLPAL